jgi:hypothetical protein
MGHVLDGPDTRRRTSTPKRAIVKDRKKKKIAVARPPNTVFSLSRFFFSLGECSGVCKEGFEFIMWAGDWREEKWRYKWYKRLAIAACNPCRRENKYKCHAIILLSLRAWPYKTRQASPIPSLPSHTHQRQIPIRPLFSQDTTRTDTQPQQRRQQPHHVRRHHRASYLFPPLRPFPSIADHIRLNFPRSTFHSTQPGDIVTVNHGNYGRRDGLVIGSHHDYAVRPSSSSSSSGQSFSNTPSYGL